MCRCHAQGSVISSQDICVLLFSTRSHTYGSMYHMRCLPCYTRGRSCVASDNVVLHSEARLYILKPSVLQRMKRSRVFIPDAVETKFRTFGSGEPHKMEALTRLDQREEHCPQSCRGVFREGISLRPSHCVERTRGESGIHLRSEAPQSLSPDREPTFRPENSPHHHVWDLDRMGASEAATAAGTGQAEDLVLKDSSALEPLHEKQLTEPFCTLVPNDRGPCPEIRSRESRCLYDTFGILDWEDDGRRVRVLPHPNRQNDSLRRNPVQGIAPLHERSRLRVPLRRSIQARVDGQCRYRFRDVYHFHYRFKMPLLHVLWSGAE